MAEDEQGPNLQGLPGVQAEELKEELKEEFKNE